ncbi:MAG: M28 family peptidase [Acidobacteria bacterium]|nr:M28 family peptidase [Acidobacteriota bacterium]
MRRFLVVCLLLSALVAQLPAGYAQQPRRGGKGATATAAASSSRSVAEGITAEQLREYLYFVASDEMEGRDTPSRGLNTVAKFIATLLARWGVKPAGDDGTYFQKIALRRARLDPAQTRVELNGQSYTYGDDFLAVPRSGTASAPLVFVGHGWLMKKKNVDAYQGLDVRNKIVVVAGNLPKGLTPNDPSNGQRGVDWMEPTEYAQKMGALALVEVPDFQTLAAWDRIRRNQQAGGVVTVTRLQEQEDAQLPQLVLSPRLAAFLFQGEKHSANEISQSMSGGEPVAPFELNPAKKLSFNISGQDESLSTQNVVGIIEGSDPNLKNEYVAVGAHYDHVGTGQPGSGSRFPSRDGSKNDIIWNGADDDGSGTVSVLSMAEALSHASRRPKRSVLFVWHCGEEKDLWGSDYFTRFPTVPLQSITAQFNIDMIGRSKKEGDTNPANKSLSGPNEIYVIGSKMMSTELGELSERINQSYLNLSFNYTYDDPKDPNRFFFRSDHYNYAAHGIPIIFYFDGVHEDYHRPGDEPQKIDYDKMQRVARTIFITLYETADLKTRPVVDKKLPSELTN